MPENPSFHLQGSYIYIKKIIKKTKLKIYELLAIISVKDTGCHLGCIYFRSWDRNENVVKNNNQGLTFMVAVTKF